MYQLWRMWHLGFGFPGGVTYDELEPSVIEALARMEEVYKRDFSSDSVILASLNGIIERQNASLKRRR